MLLKALDFEQYFNSLKYLLREAKKKEQGKKVAGEFTMWRRNIFSVCSAG